MQELPTKTTRKFKTVDQFDKHTKVFQLLPFRFMKLNAGKEVLVSEVGDFLIVPLGTAHKIVSRKLSKIGDADLFLDLLAGFFICESPIPPLINILAARYRTKKSFLDRFTSLHIFVITLRCEHTCQYCQVSRVSQDKLTFDMARRHIHKGVDLMMRSPNQCVTMEFQGGEALLAFDEIIYAVELAQRKAAEFNKQITFVICTNLAPINEQILTFCKSHSIIISTSLDGPDFIHNQNRHKKGNDSYELAIKGINLTRKILGEDKISALLTTTKLSLKHPNEIVDEYVTRKFKSIFIRPISPYGFAVKNQKRNDYPINDFLIFYKHALARIIEYNKEGYFIREDYASIILKKMLTPYPTGYVDLQSPAGLINSVIVFNYDGKIYASDESRMLAEMKDDTFELGHLDTHSYNEIFYGSKAQEFSQVWSNESLPGCSDCALQSYCGADPVFHYATQGSLIGHRPTSDFCSRNMQIIKHLFELMDTDTRIERIFRSWVTGKN